MGDLLTGQLVRKGPEVSRMTQAISIALITTIMLQVPYFAYRMKINLKPKEEFFSLFTVSEGTIEAAGGETTPMVLLVLDSGLLEYRPAKKDAPNAATRHACD